MLAFALKTLASERSKMLTGLAGVLFSVVLVSVQGGLYLGLMRKASLLVDHCVADLWVTHRQVENVDLARDIPELWLNRLAAVPGVSGVSPYIVGKGTASLRNGHMEDVWIIGSDRTTMWGTGWDFVEGSVESLRRPYGVSFDDVDAPKLGFPQVNDWLEVNGQQTRLVARTHGITGFITMPYLFTTLDTAKRLARTPSGACSFLLVRLEPEASVDEVRRILQTRVPQARVMTPPEFARMSQDYWMKRTGIGVSFGAATLLGLLVGFVVVGQSLYALALDHLDEYATLKALGAEDTHVCQVIVTQALLIGAVGSLLGGMVVFAIRSFWNSPLAPIVIPTPLLAGAIGTVLLICLVASLLPFLRIRRIDAAMVLMG